MAELKHEIKKPLGVLSTSNRGWSKELNFVSWNDKEARYDLREWSNDHERMGKGITLTTEEMKALKEILSNVEI